MSNGGPSSLAGSGCGVDPNALQAEFQLGFTFIQAAARPRGLSAGEDLSRLVGRFQSLRQLRHPNLCRYLEILIGRDHLVAVVTEHAAPTLADLLRPAVSASAPLQALGEPLALRVVRDVVPALCHLNAHGLVHGHLEADAVLLAEGGCIKLAGHGLGHLVRYGRLADFALRPRGAYLAPELAYSGSSAAWGATAAMGPSCKADVWSLGILLLEVVHGPWCAGQPDDHSNPAGPDDAATVLRFRVQFETACGLRRFVSGNSRDQTALTAAMILSDGALPMGDNYGDVVSGLPLPSVFPAGSDPQCRQLEISYRQWVSGRTSSHGSQDIRDLWNNCLTANPAGRPSPADLASHPCLAMAPEGEDRGTAGNIRWTSCPALKCERVVQQSLREYQDTGEARTPLEYLRSLGMVVEDVYYWWNLAGGDAFETLTERRVLRPPPPIFLLPFYVRDSGADDERGVVVSFLGARTELGSRIPTGPDASQMPGSTAWAAAAAARGGDAAKAAAAAEAAAAAASENEEARDDRHTLSMGLWGPPTTLRPRCVGVSLRNLCRAVALAEKHGIAAVSTLRLPSIYNRQHHFAYQWLRARTFERLIGLMPGSHADVFREAAEDVPPNLRAKIWSALLGADCDSDRASWTPFYEQLLASKSEATAEERKTAMQSVIAHELLSHPEGRRRLERLVYAALKANPAITRSEGMGGLASTLAVLYADNEPAAFMSLQRILHSFLWNFYAQEGPMQRRQSMHLFSALLRFADPQLELHLQNIGMQPEVYTTLWFPAWFSQAFPLQQLLLLWDAILLRPPQYPLFIGVCLLHFFRRSLLAMDEATGASTFLASCAHLIDVAVLVQASIALFQAVPASVTLPLYPRHSAGDALLVRPGSVPMTAMDPSWTDGQPMDDSATNDETSEVRAARELLGQRAMQQWRQCDWWRRRAASALTSPIITVDDLLSFRSRCFVLDVQSFEDFVEGHFQSSCHIRDPESDDLRNVVPAEVLNLGVTPGGADPHANGVSLSVPSGAVGGGAGLGGIGGSGVELADSMDVAAPWLFAFDPTDGGPSPELRVRLVVVVGGNDDCGAAFAERLLCAGVRHVVCLLGGAAALRQDAPSYLAAGNE